MTAPLRLLIIEEDDREAQRIEHAVCGSTFDASMHRARSIAEARTLLRETPCRVVLLNHTMRDGNSFDFLRYMHEQALDIPVVVCTQDSRNEVAITALKAGASDCLVKDAGHRYLDDLSERLQEAVHRHTKQHLLRSKAQEHMLDALRHTIADVKHEINNPLAIISGNAQLLLELARAMDLDDELVKPIFDIEEASQRIAHSLERLDGLKDAIAAAFGLEEESFGSHRNGQG